MIGVLGPDFFTDEAILDRGATWVNEANFVMKHSPESKHGVIYQIDRYADGIHIF